MATSLNKTTAKSSTKEIVDKRVINGVTEYCLRLQGSDDSSWEKVENLDCPSLIAAFEKKLTKRSTKSKAEGFNRGLSPERILGATTRDGKIEFLMKWKLCDELDLVQNAEASEKCPQLVIKFYEDRLSFGDDN